LGRHESHAKATGGMALCIEIDGLGVLQNGFFAAPD
jgi:hypothetical protein